MDAIHNGRGDAHASAAPDEPQDQENGGINKTVATVVVVAAGAALFEAALLPGLVLGVAAMAAPKYLPKPAPPWPKERFAFVAWASAAKMPARMTVPRSKASSEAMLNFSPGESGW